MPFPTSGLAYLNRYDCLAVVFSSSRNLVWQPTERTSYGELLLEKEVLVNELQYDNWNCY